ncbi:MAG: hypothetical protein ACI84O_001631 [Myxococcota bacterium]|jgi:uncharacterized protein (DUF1697 family)
MKTWIALLRGINVGGKNILAMADLRSSLEGLGLSNVRSYIQSGNVVFDSKAKTAVPLLEKISKAIEAHHGLRPQLLLLSHEELLAAVAANPFTEAVAEPSTLHLFFLATAASNPDMAALATLKTASEQFELIENVFYLHAPDGIGRSKLAGKVEKHLGVVATARNYRTVAKLVALANIND